MVIPIVIMALTRHLYVLEEVRTALSYCLKNRNIIESMFWCQELYVSGHDTEARNILFETWLWFFGPSARSWLYKWNDTKIDVLTLCYNLVSFPASSRDASIWVILLSEATTRDMPPDRITKKHFKQISAIVSDPMERYFMAAIDQGKTRAAWWSAQYMETDRTWSLLRQSMPEHIPLLDILRGATNSSIDIVVRCVAVLVCASSQSCEEVQPTLEIDPRTVAKLVEWEAISGNRNRRVFEIPLLCLYGITERGRTPYTESNLRKLAYFEPYLKGGIWDIELGNRGGRLVKRDRLEFRDDDIFDEFYNTIFSDDIPDEWPLIDQKKSHGDGVMSPGENFNVHKFVRIWIGTIATKYIWGVRSQLSTWLDGLQFGGERGFAEVVKYYNGKRSLTEQCTTLLRPVKKVLVIGD